MHIHDIIRRKGEGVITVRPDTTTSDLLGLLVEHRIGAVVVSEDGESVAGIVSERDVVKALAARGADALQEQVSVLMTTEVYTCVPDDSLETLAATMTEQRVRHLPVMVDGKLKAIVSIGDIVKHRIDELQDEKDYLIDYIQR